MSADPQTLHTETFEQLSHVIEQDADLLVDLWSEQAITEQPNADPNYRAEMRDQLPAFLRALAASLRRTDSAENGSHRIMALEHGEQRWNVGWQLSEVVRDYQLLRLVLHNHLPTNLGRPLTMRESMAIGMMLDEAIGAAVVMYVAHQERRLGGAEEQIRGVMNSVADGILVVDRSATITLANTAIERIFGYSAAELIGLPLKQLLHETPQSPVPAAANSILAIASQQQPNRRQARGKRSNNSYFDVELAETIFERDSEEYSILLVRDISDQKRLELELKATARELESLNNSLARLTAEAESSNRAKSVFLANMSHEIRTPMTAILGYVELLGIELRQPNQLEAIDTIKRNAHFLLEIINDVLDLAKIEARRYEVEQAVVSPMELVAEVNSLLMLRAASKQIALTVEAADGVPARIASDPKRLKQILINLVGNAIKFTDQGEVKIHVVTRRVSRGDELVFAVRDSGVGIPPDELAVVFEPFSQVRATATEQRGGTGLGLTICKHLAELLGGRIEAESQLNHGSTFRLILPIVQPSVNGNVPSQPAKTIPEPKTSRLSCKVLAADDQPDNRVLVAEFLRRSGATVTVVENGLIAVETVLAAEQAGEPFDVILMDMQMPELDGYQATARLRQAGIAAPIIALTASAMKGDEKRCLEMGCNDYLTKPVDFSLLVETLTRQLSATS